ncbi:sigma-70 family RNA polymerase sigma factor [Oleiagrimonas sp. C23AA]|uniref:sigma-70 family RNA polymerase sigma factor n=1 Tax=Oleiagrimonas sp. C23AA TaxID=2719047 RepID=UPI001F10EF88|nr:sigma-70 family RNA polymerase sigma factor [Oleiagrimonas sp. C23AA]
MKPSTDTYSREVLTTTLHAVAGGDKQAFEQLYQMTSAKLFGICLGLLPQRSDAEDVLQDVYVTVWQKAAQFREGRATAMTWLISIARNKSIDRLRARGTLQRSSPIDLAGPLSDPAPEQPEVVEAEQESQRLDGCMNTLDPKQRAAIRVAFMEGVTHDALASRAGVPLGTMKSWIRRGLHRLKACLER